MVLMKMGRAGPPLEPRRRPQVGKSGDPRSQNADTTHCGFEFLKGNFEGLKGYAVGRMTKSRRGKIYIDDAGWGPEAGSIEYGYRVPFGSIHVFIGKIGDPARGPAHRSCR